MISLETPRLIVRDHLPTDGFNLFSLLSRPEEMRYLPELAVDSLDGALANLAVALAEQLDPGRTKFFLAIIEKASLKYIGEIGFTISERAAAPGIDPGRSARADLGWFIKQEYQGKGYTTEAGQAVLHFGFEEAGIHKFTAGCLAENRASERLMQKLGFAKEGELASHQFHEGQWKDRVLYGLTEPAWRAQWLKPI